MNKQLDLLKQELKQIQENIERLEKFKKENQQYKQYSSLVVGELKHRLIALKQRITLVCKITTHEYLS